MEIKERNIPFLFLTAITLNVKTYQDRFLAKPLKVDGIMSTWKRYKSIRMTVWSNRICVSNTRDWSLFTELSVDTTLL